MILKKDKKSCKYENAVILSGSARGFLLRIVRSTPGECAVFRAFTGKTAALGARPGEAADFWEQVVCSKHGRP